MNSLGFMSVQKKIKRKISECLTNIVGSDVPSVKERKDHAQGKDVIELMEDSHLVKLGGLMVSKVVG
jgi:hypothetical protein